MKQNHNVNGNHQLPLLSSHHPLNALSHHTLTTASGLTFYQISTKEQVTKLRELDQFRRTLSERWITTWNDYLVRIKHFFRWLHNCNFDQAKDHPSSSTDWYTPGFVNIKKERTKRLSPYGEHEIWDIKDLQTVIKYEPHKRNKAILSLFWDLNGRNHEITLPRLKRIRLNERYGEGECA